MTARRSRFELTTPAASPQQAAAIVAALERFLRDTAAPPRRGSEPRDAWRAAAILEGVSRDPGDDAPHPWINT